MCYSEHARRYLNREGVAMERTFVTGSPMAEVLSVNLDKVRASGVLVDLGLVPRGYILLSAHREENIDNGGNFLSLMNAVNAMAERYGLPVIYSVHPRSAKFIKERGFRFHENVRELRPFSFSDYNCLQMNAFCVVSDSGTLPEESAWFGSIGCPFPAVCIRTSTERPEALDKGVFVLAGITAERVLQAIDVAVGLVRDGDFGVAVPDYCDVNVSGKVVRLIQGYAGVVDKVVWGKCGYSY